MEQPGPSGPGGNANRHSDFARRKYSSIFQVRVPRKWGPRGRRIWTRSVHPEPPPSGSLVTFCGPIRPTGAWLFQNCCWFGLTAAPGCAGQVVAGTNPGGRPKGLPYPISEDFLESRSGGAEGESAEGREKPPWGVPLPRAGLGPAPTIKMDGFRICRRGGSKTRPSRNSNMFL